jgi:four helix bundle protein
MSTELKARTKAFSLSIIDLTESLNTTTAQRVIQNQLIRSSSSVGANYRAACRARSDREFIAKMRIVLEEADESCFWLEIIDEKNWMIVQEHLREANELTAIFVTIIKKMNFKNEKGGKK